MKEIIIALCLLLSAEFTLAKPEVILNLNLNVEEWMKSCPESLQTNQTIQTLSSIGISNIVLNVQADEEKLFTIAKATTSLPNPRTAWQNQTNLFQVLPDSPNTFQWTGSTSNQSLAEWFQKEGICIWFSGQDVLFADSSRRADAETLSASTNHKSLLQGEIHLNPLVNPLLKTAKELADLQKQGFGKAIMLAMLKTLERSTQSIEDFPDISMAIDLLDDNMRRMNFALHFHDEITAAGMRDYFNSMDDAWKNPEISNRQLALVKLIDTPYFNNMEQSESTLTFSYEWTETDDQAIAQMIIKSVFGALFSFHDPGDFPANDEKTMPAPILKNMEAFDAVAAAQKIKEATYPDSQQPTLVRFVVDYLDLPNADLIKSSITNACLLDTNQVNIINSDRPGSFSLTQYQAARIHLSKKEDTGSAQTASFTLNLDVPTEIERYTLTRENPLIETDEGGVCLLSMSNSVVSLRSKNISLNTAKIYARNQNGKYLSRSGATWSDSRLTARYDGIPDSLDVVIPIRYEGVSVVYTNLPADMDSKPKMPDSPTDNVPTRYSYEPGKTFCNPDINMIKKGAMLLSTNAGWRKNRCELQFPKQPLTAVKSTSLRTYLAGSEVLAFEGSSGGYTDNKFCWSIRRTNMLHTASALFGEVELTFWSGIDTCTVKVSTNPVPLFEGKAEPMVHVDRNVLWVGTMGNAGKVLDIQAFDSSDRQLKKDFRRSFDGKAEGYHFWGQPTRTTVTYAHTNITVKVPFKLELKEGGLADIPAAWKKAFWFDELVDHFVEISKKSRHFSNLLSGSYYWIRSKGDYTKRLLRYSHQSDPAGAAIFGYELKPYHGYYLKKIPTAYEAKNPKEKKQFEWSEGTFEAVPGSGALLAMSVNEKDPNILVTLNYVYVHYGDCSQLEHVPESMYQSDWIQVR